MNLQALGNELTNDPLGRGYAEMSAPEVADDLNTAYRTRIRDSMSGDELFGATDASEFAGLTDHKQQAWLAFCGRATIDPQGAANVAFVQWVFGAGSATLSALADAREVSISRAEELGLGRVRTGDVQMARSE